MTHNFISNYFFRRQESQFEETYISDGNYDHDTEKVIEEIEEFHDIENNDDNPPEDQLEVNETTVTNVDLDQLII